MGRLFGVRSQPAQLDQVILICFPAVVTSVVLYGLYYYLQGDWQLLAVAGGGGLALAGLGLSLLLNRRYPEAAALVLLLSLLAVVGVVPLFIEGVTLYLIPSASLLILVVGAKLLPGRWRIWLVIAALFGLSAWLIERWAPLPRYTPSASGLQSLYMLGISIAFLAVPLWHTALALLGTFTSIRAQLFITSLLLVLFTGGTISYFSTVVLRHQEQDDAVEWLRAVTARKADEIELWVDHVQVSLDLLVHHGSPELAVVLAPQIPRQADYHHALEHLRADLAETLGHTRLYEGLYLFDASGAALLTVGGAAATWLPLDAECIRQLRDRPCVQPPRYYAPLGKIAVVATQPVLTSDGRIIGVVAGYATIEALNTIVSETDGLGDTGVAYLIGSDHTIFTPVWPQQEAISFAVRPAAARSSGSDRAVAARTSGSDHYNDERGVPVVGVYRWLPSLQVALLVEQDQAEAYESSATLLNVHLGVTLILLTTAAVTALYLVRSITAPIAQLSATAEQIAEGALDRAPDVEQGGEIGGLARAFNRMTTRLQQARDQLELRVKWRTEELARANAKLEAENAVRTHAEQVVQLERNKLKSILDAIEDGVYIVSQGYAVEYANPTLEREFGPTAGRKCYEYLYDRAEVCPWCPNEQVWQGILVRRDETRPDGRCYEIYDRPLENADGTLSKLAIFHDVTAHRRAQEEILQRNRELATLSRQLVDIQEQERHHISRELHDETSQALTSLMLRLGMLERDMQQGVAVAERVAELKHMLEEVLEGLHRLATDLRPPSLDHVGLVAALRQYAERLSEGHELVVDFGAIDLDEERLPREMEITIYRIVQEALVNVVRHARATHADVIVERRPGQVRVIVEDNGCGFETATASYSGRLGLLGMRERAEMLGGRLVIDSSPGVGTTLLVEAPYDGSHPDCG